VCAGQYRLLDLQLNVRQILDQFLSGKLSTPHGELNFPASDVGNYGATYISFHPDALGNQRRISVLQLLGGQLDLLRQPDLDWEIKASDMPYDGLQELMNEYLLGPLIGSTINVEIAAFNIAELDTVHSTVHENKAHIHVIASEAADVSKIRIGYRIKEQDRILIRLTILPNQVRWTLRDGAQYGEAIIEVPAAAIINGVVSYNGIAQHHWWFSNPSTFPNARRTVYEGFDPNLAILQDIIAKAQGRNQEARQLESAIAWLLWMLGFNVAHLGGTPRMQDAVDLIATAPSGNFVVIECTTGLLKAENKLALLHDRTECVRRSLSSLNQSFLRVLPMIITSKTREEVRPDIEQAERLGIFVATKETIEQMINRTLVLSNANQLYEEVERETRAAQVKYETQQTFPLPSQSF
jgi:hypothetical protein